MKIRRKHEIVEYVQKHKYCSLPELMEQFNVSVATIYRDVSELVALRQLRKVHGGVAYIEQNRETPDSRSAFYQSRLIRNREVKHIIASQAMAEINDGDTLFLDSSTTVYYLSKLIQNSGLSSLTIITNSLLIIQEFPLFPHDHTRIALGGNYDLQLNAFLGQDTLNHLKRYSIGKMFFSALGITPGGIFSQHESHALFLQQVMELSQRRYLLMDSEKFDRTAAVRIGSLHDVDSLLSESEIPGYFVGRQG